MTPFASANQTACRARDLYIAQRGCGAGDIVHVTLCQLADLPEVGVSAPCVPGEEMPRHKQLRREVVRLPLVDLPTVRPSCHIGVAAPPCRAILVGWNVVVTQLVGDRKPSAAVVLTRCKHDAGGQARSQPNEASGVAGFSDLGLDDLDVVFGEDSIQIASPRPVRQSTCPPEKLGDAPAVRTWSGGHGSPRLGVLLAEVLREVSDLLLRLVRQTSVLTEVDLLSG